MRQISHYNWKKKKNVIKVMLSRLHDNLNTSFVLFIIFISFLTCYQWTVIMSSLPAIISLLDYFDFHFIFELLLHNNYEFTFGPTLFSFCFPIIIMIYVLFIHFIELLWRPLEQFWFHHCPRQLDRYCNGWNQCKSIKQPTNRGVCFFSSFCLLTNFGIRTILVILGMSSILS